MKESNMRIKNGLILSLTILLGMVGFYKWMTSDRKTHWCKEMESELKQIATVHGFHPSVNATPIRVDQIQLPTEQKWKIRIQKGFGKIHLRKDAPEFGSLLVFESNDSQGLLQCKWSCLGDHVMGIEIESQKLNPQTLIRIKDDLNRLFNNYEIVWTDAG
jgi:hypothetical protein